MSTVTVYLKDQKRFGTKMHLAHAGDVEIAKDGSFEVKNEATADMLEETYPALISKTKAGQNKPAIADPSDPSARKDWVDKLKAMRMQDLRELATQSNLEEEKWKDLPKPKLIEYLADEMIKAAFASKKKDDDEEED